MTCTFRDRAAFLSGTKLSDGGGDDGRTCAPSTEMGAVLHHSVKRRQTEGGVGRARPLGRRQTNLGLVWT